MPDHPTGRLSKTENEIELLKRRVSSLERAQRSDAARLFAAEEVLGTLGQEIDIIERRLDDDENNDDDEGRNGTDG